MEWTCYLVVVFRAKPPAGARVGCGVAPLARGVIPADRPAGRKGARFQPLPRDVAAAARKGRNVMSGSFTGANMSVPAEPGQARNPGHSRLGPQIRFWQGRLAEATSDGSASRPYL